MGNETRSCILNILKDLDFSDSNPPLPPFTKQLKEKITIKKGMMLDENLNAIQSSSKNSIENNAEIKEFFVEYNTIIDLGNY